jgi:uncharacterized protein
MSSPQQSSRPALRAIGAALLLGAAACLASAGDSAAGAPWRETARKFAAEHFRHPAWGYSHSLRDYALARQLASDDHVALDDDVLYAACMLHDMAAFAPWEDPKADHADVATRTIDQVLAGSGFPEAKLDAVRGAIRTHMYDRAPQGPEATYLHDADALDWLGAIGVARLFGTVDANGGQPDGPAALKMLQGMLKDVPAGVRSPAGRKLLATRQAELERFLGELGAESSGFGEL